MAWSSVPQKVFSGELNDVAGAAAGVVRDTPTGPDNDRMPLKAVYELDREAARELANKTVHTVMHLGWTEGADGDHELRMAVLVKPNGLFGRLYLAAIAPFRYLIVYPALTRQWERAWRETTTAP